MKERMAFGHKIRKARQDKGLSTQNFAYQVGISVDFAGQIERGEKYPSLEVFISILNVLGISSDLLLSTPFAVKKQAVLNEITEKMTSLKPEEIHTIAEIIDVYLANRPLEENLV